MKIKAVALLTLVIGVLPGCASIMSKSDYTVNIHSSPEGARYSIVNKKGIEVMTGTTPDQVTLKANAGYFSGEKYTISMTKDGYRDGSTILNSDIDPWYLGNIIFGGLLGALVIDPASGAMFMLRDDMRISLMGIPASEVAGEAYQPNDIEKEMAAQAAAQSLRQQAEQSEN